MKTVLGVWRSGWAQGLIALAALVLAFVVIWWRGPDWGTVFDAFKVVIWSWIVLAFCSTSSRRSSAHSPGG